MKLDLVFALIDCDTPNRDWYRAAASMMIASARRAYRAHDTRVVQIADEASEIAADVDVRYTAASKVERDELMQYRGHCLAEWALQTDRPLVFCDVDLLWNTDGITGCLYTPNSPIQSPPGIVLTQRKNLLQPYNGGLILSQPGQKRWWETYRAMMSSDTMPVDIRGWWGDQIALAVMMGAPEDGKIAARRFGSTVACLPVDLVAPSPKSEPTQVLGTPAIHLKGGKRKPWMAGYFERLMSETPLESHAAVG